MRKELHYDPDLCTGCMSCNTFCAQRNEGVSGLMVARLRLSLRPFTGDYELHYCHQCEDAACAQACPVEAIRQHPDGYWEIDYEDCIGCQACVDACEHGAMFYDPIGDRVLKCHTCQGNPTCAEVCPAGALVWAVAVSEQA